MSRRPICGGLPRSDRPWIESTTLMPPKKTAATAKPTPKTVAAKPAAAKAKPAAAAQATISLKQVAAELSDAHELERRDTEKLLDGMVEVLIAHLKKGNRLRLGSLGILQVKDSPARLGRNPATGEQIQIAAKKKIAFRPAKDLKEALLS